MKFIQISLVCSLLVLGELKFAHGVMTFEKFLSNFLPVVMKVETGWHTPALKITTRWEQVKSAFCFNPETLDTFLNTFGTEQVINTTTTTLLRTELSSTFASDQSLAIHATVATRLTNTNSYADAAEAFNHKKDFFKKEGVPFPEQLADFNIPGNGVESFEPAHFQKLRHCLDHFMNAQRDINLETDARLRAISKRFIDYKKLEKEIDDLLRAFPKDSTTKTSEEIRKFHDDLNKKVEESNTVMGNIIVGINDIHPLMSLFQKNRADEGLFFMNKDKEKTWNPDRDYLLYEKVGSVDCPKMRKPEVKSGKKSK